MRDDEEIIVVSPLHIDREIAEFVINNHYWFRNPDNLPIDMERAEMLIKHVLFRDDFVITFFSKWAQNGHISRVNTDESIEMFRNGYMPNPHLYYYSDIGPYHHEFFKRLMNGDDVRDLCEACNSFLNVGDPVVFERFVELLFSDEYRFIQLPDGKMADWKEAIVYIEKEEKENE